MIGAHAQHLCQRKAAEGIKGVELVFIFSCYNTDLTTQHLFLPLLSAALNLSLPPPGPRGDDRITDHADKCGCRHPPSPQPLWYFKHSQCADFASLIYRCGGGWVGWEGLLKYKWPSKHFQRAPNGAGRDSSAYIIH